MTVLSLIAVSPFLMSGEELEVSFVSLRSGSWARGGRDFKLVADGSSENDRKTSVMVSFKPGSSLAQSLRMHHNLLGFHSSYKSGVGRAVVGVDSSDEVNQLAFFAHRDIKACGAIELLKPNLATLELQDAESPAIATSVKLASVQNLIEQVKSENLAKTTTDLVALGTRHHETTAVDATAALEGIWQTLLPAGANLSKESHQGTPQKSLVLRIPGTSQASQTVVLGAHLDSINPINQNTAPGADDDASGVAALTEVLRVIKSSSATFSRSIELHAYAAEEVGLVGSSGLANKALANGQKITAMLQLDMIGYNESKTKQTLHIISTDTSPILVRHLKDILSNYLGSEWAESELSAGTSDHKSWHRSGVHSIFAFEDPKAYNRSLHSEQDVTSKLDFTYAARFAKTALAFLAHEAGLSSGISDGASKWSTQIATKDLIKLGITRRKDGTLRFAAAVSDTLNATKAELCQVKTGIEQGCKSLVTSVNLAKQRNARRYFLSNSDVDLAQGQLWRMHLYDSLGGLVALRTVKLKQN